MAFNVIVQQSLIAALAGYPLAMLVSAFVVSGSAKGGAAILLPWQLAAALFVLTVVMCVSAALVSINKVTRLDPAMVFKG
jgi:putative ABC transport system permease protein